MRYDLAYSQAAKQGYLKDVYFYYRKWFIYANIHCGEKIILFS